MNEYYYLRRFGASIKDNSYINICSTFLKNTWRHFEERQVCASFHIIKSVKDGQKGQLLDFVTLWGFGL